MSGSLEIVGATITVNDQGVNLKYGWMVDQQIQTEDVLKLRDWLNLKFPQEKPQ